MYFLLPYLLASIAASQGSTENTSLPNQINLPTPHIYGISDPFDDKDGPIIHWMLDENSDSGSVLGYKVKLWQVGCTKKPKYKYVDGERVRLKNVMPRLRDYSTLRNLTEIIVEGANTTDVVLKSIEPDVPYHMTVTAYGAAGTGDEVQEGPPSSPFRFQHRGPYTCREI